ncbi:MAG: hypothetical protein ACFFD2_09420 [Promethearchaeota archaeon]
MGTTESHASEDHGRPSLEGRVGERGIQLPSGSGSSISELSCLGYLFKRGDVFRLELPFIYYKKFRSAMLEGEIYLRLLHFKRNPTRRINFLALNIRKQEITSNIAPKMHFKIAI